VDEPLPDVVRFVTEQAILAPSGANCQPWHFYYGDGTLWVVLDPVRAESVLDGRSRAALLALGAATENIAIAAAHRGYRALVEPFPDPTTPTIAAAIRLEADPTAAQSGLASAFPYIAQRATNRQRGTRVPLEPELAAVLCRTATAHGAHLELVSAPADLDEAGRILGEGDRVRCLCPALHAEMMGEIRWTPEAAQASRDGLDLATLELTPTERVAMHVLARPDVAAFLRSRREGRAIADSAEQAVAGASAVGLLRIGQDTPAAWLQGGRAFQQVWLAATARALALHPWTALPYMIAMLDTPAAEVFNADEQAILRALDARLERLFAEHRGAPRAVIFRLASAPEPTARSRRRPIAWVLHPGLPPRGAGVVPSLVRG
jgi:nitroreductase